MSRGVCFSKFALSVSFAKTVYYLGISNVFHFIVVNSKDIFLYSLSYNHGSGMVEERSHNLYQFY